MDYRCSKKRKKNNDKKKQTPCCCFRFYILVAMFETKKENIELKAKNCVLTIAHVIKFSF